MTPASTTTRDGLLEDAPRLVLMWHRAGEPPEEFGVWPERPVTIGRDATNLIVLDSPFVSKAHARIRYEDGHYVVEDLRSANGIRVNGSRIEVTTLKPGDVIEIGDQELSLAIRSEASTRKRAKRSGSPSRPLLAVGGVILAAIFGVVLWSVYSPQAGLAPRESESPRTDSAPPSRPSATVAVPVIGDEPEIVMRVVTQAPMSGNSPVAALFDEAMLQYRGGRLRDTQILLRAALRRDPSHELARLRLGQVEQECQRSILDHMTRGDLAFSQLRYDDAVIEWEQVQLLTEPGDPRYQRAEQKANEARRARGR
ncbi:MAG: FHA domain-containing protein [Acidobacteria bacterium]|nr:FHA domain-containing protein [Acidobacteriota bacterium]